MAAAPFLLGRGRDETAKGDDPTQRRAEEKLSFRRLVRDRQVFFVAKQQRAFHLHHGTNCHGEERVSLRKSAHPSLAALLLNSQLSTRNCGGGVPQVRGTL